MSQKLKVTYEVQISQDEKINGVFYTRLGGGIDRVWRKNKQNQWTPTFPVFAALYQTRFTPNEDIPAELWTTVKKFYNAEETA